jgi:hypothetical protein
MLQRNMAFFFEVIVAISSIGLGKCLFIPFLVLVLVWRAEYEKPM